MNSRFEPLVSRFDLLNPRSDKIFVVRELKIAVGGQVSAFAVTPIVFGFVVTVIFKHVVTIVFFYINNELGV